MRVRVIVGSILIFSAFLVINFFIGGWYFALDQLFWELGILLGVTLFWTFVPGILLNGINNRLYRKKGILVCSINSLILMFVTVGLNVVIIANLGSVDPTQTWSWKDFAKDMIIANILFGVIYYFVNYLFFVESKKNK